jgi:hypothetical protein
LCSRCIDPKKAKKKAKVNSIVPNNEDIAAKSRIRISSNSASKSNAQMRGKIFCKLIYDPISHGKVICQYKYEIFSGRLSIGRSPFINDYHFFNVLYLQPQAIKYIAFKYNQPDFFNDSEIPSFCFFVQVDTHGILE